MMTSPSFLALWQETGARTEAQLHIFAPELHEIVPIGNVALKGTALEDCLPASAVSVVSAAVEERHRKVLLLLDRSLPDAWIRFPWETLNMAGNPIAGRLLVVRCADVAFDVSTHKRSDNTFYLNLFPTREFNFARAFESLVKAQRLRPCTRAFVATQIQGASDLFLLAHGDARGILDQEGSHYDFPHTRAMPDRIWLLACNTAGAMDKLAQELLSLGARTVIAATEDLSAPQMAAIIGDWLNQPDIGDPVSWLTGTQLKKSSDGGVHTLTVWGEIIVDASIATPWNRLTWKMAHGDDPRLPFNEDTGKEEFRAAIAILDAPETWPLTSKWMMPPLLSLSEMHDHELMRQLQHRFDSTTSPEAISGLALAARRVGNYPLAARYLGQGLGNGNPSNKVRTTLLGALANLLIDLDLPESAAIIIATHEDEILDKPKAQQLNDYLRLDWMARCAARRGYLQIAVDQMAAKRRLVGIDDSREVAWLLYLRAWTHFDPTKTIKTEKLFATEALTKLREAKTVDVAHGNESIAYMLRALAAHLWATHDGSVLPLLLRWRPFVEECLSLEDPGPWSYTLIFMYLAGQVDYRLFDRSMEALTRARYFLETTMFFSLAGRDEERLRSLDRFHKRRIRTIAELKGCTSDLGIDPVAEIVVRCNAEMYPFMDPWEMVVKGVLPL